MTRVMVVEDEKSLREPLVYLLRKEGFETIEAADGPKAIKLCSAGGIDLILLDLMLPGMSGSEVCRKIRATSQVPIIMLTAKDSEPDKVVGLEIGADDYVTKPYSTRELLARMKAVLRRNSPTAPDSVASQKAQQVYEFGQIVMDVDRHTVSLAGKAVSLPLKEYELLELLLENVNRVMTRAQIIDRVWGSDYFGDTKTLDVHIKRLRSKLESDPANPVHLLTVRGLGYKFEA